MRTPIREIRPVEAAIGFLGAVAIDLACGGAVSSALTHRAPGEPRLALVSLGLLVLSIGLSILAGYLLQKTVRNPFDDKPTPLASRGSYISWFCGVRRLGYVLVWAGIRGVRKERGEGGKGDSFSGPKQRVYVESGCHVICTGPVDELLEIESGGEKIFVGPITRVSHPSGTLIDMGKEGAFRVFWGEDDQPVNTWLGDASRLGVSSRWPGICYIEWRNRRLGPSPSWPFMSYVMVKRPTGSYLSDTDPWTEPTYTLDGPTYGPPLSVNAGLRKLSFFGERVPLKIGDRVRYAGDSTLADLDLDIVSVTRSSGFLSLQLTEVIVEESITGATGDGTVQLYTRLDDDGANAAHALADMLFEPWPRGLSLDTSDWDMDSLEAMGTDTEAEGLLTSWVVSDAATAQERIGAGLQDLGYMLPIDSATGLVKFQKLREPTGTLAHLDDDMVVDSMPELEKLLGERPVDFMVFTFPDRAVTFREMTIGRMEDGQIGLLDVARARKVPITCTVNYDAAAIIANRRTQEEMAQGAIWTIRTNRASREWLPGQAITADFTSEVLRVLEVEPVPDSNIVNLQVTTDTYGIQVQNFDDTAPPPPTGTEDVLPDIIAAMVEVPEYLDGVPPQTLLIPRVRAHSSIDSATLHLSADGATYTPILTTEIHNPGGTLTTALSADGFFEPDDGEVQFTVLGPDIADVQDLTGDDTNWRLGRQLAIIVSTAGTEICFLKKVTVVSGSTYSLDGLIRARYDTRRLAHPVGAFVFIVTDVSSEVSPIQDPLLLPEVTRYAKTQPSGNGTVALSETPEMSKALYGKGVRPPAVAGLRVTAPDLVNAYSSGDDVTVVWDYATPRAPGTSAGLQEAGQAVGTTSPEGSFVLEILTLADAVVRTESATSATYTYSNANLISDLGSEVGFKVRVTQLRDGYQSDTRTLTVEKL